jgi:hypothetical protein
MKFVVADKASIQNVMNTTRIFVNPDMPEVEAFKNRYAFYLFFSLAAACACIFAWLPCEFSWCCNLMY